MFFLFLTVLLCSLTAICSTQTSPETHEIKSSNEPNSIFAKDSNFTFQAPGGFKDKELVYKFIFSVFLVILAGAGAVYFSKRFGGRISRLSGKKVQVVETLYLGSRKAVHLLKIGQREILIGSTNENISMLADVTETFSNFNSFGEHDKREEE